MARETDSRRRTQTTTMNTDNVSPPQRQLIVILENASLEAAQLSFRSDAKLQLLNCDEHQSILKRLGRDISDARPDIVHQVLWQQDTYFTWL